MFSIAYIKVIFVITVFSFFYVFLPFLVNKDDQKTHRVAIILRLSYAVQIMKLGQNARTCPSSCTVRICRASPSHYTRDLCVEALNTKRLVDRCECQSVQVRDGRKTPECPYVNDVDDDDDEETRLVSRDLVVDVVVVPFLRRLVSTPALPPFCC